MQHVTANDEWVAVIADSWWTAERAMKTADPKFSGERSPADMRNLFDKAIANIAGSEWFSRGNYSEAVRGSRPLAATYYAAPSQHLGLEPVTATARVSNGEVELWAATQAPRFGHAYGALYPMPSGEPAKRRAPATSASAS